MLSAEGEEDQRQTSTKSEKSTNNLLNEREAINFLSRKEEEKDRRR